MVLFLLQLTFSRCLLACSCSYICSREFAATELRGLRVAISSFLDMALVSTKMLQEFS